jgi:anthranilate/para-aminobenzoate synthase component II
VQGGTEDGAIMAVRHRQYDCHGVQFHPESILTPGGMDLLRNFVDLCRSRRGK